MEVPRRQFNSTKATCPRLFQVWAQKLSRRSRVQLRRCLMYSLGGKRDLSSSVHLARHPVPWWRPSLFWLCLLIVFPIITKKPNSFTHALYCLSICFFWSDLKTVYPSRSVSAVNRSKPKKRSPWVTDSRDHCQGITLWLRNIFFRSWEFQQKPRLRQEFRPNWEDRRLLADSLLSSPLKTFFSQWSLRN